MITSMDWKQVFSDSYTILDLETSGLHPESGDRIIEVGILEVNDNIPSKPLSWIINPSYPHPFHIPTEVTILTGISDTQISYGADGKEFYPSLMNRLFGRSVVGHNVLRFDSDFLSSECERLCILPPANKDWIDTASIFKGMRLSESGHSWAQEPNILEDLANYNTFWDYGTMILEKRIKKLYYNLPYCCETLGIDTSDIKFHRAGGDVTATYRVREKLKELIL